MTRIALSPLYDTDAPGYLSVIPVLPEGVVYSDAVLYEYSADDARPYADVASPAANTAVKLVLQSAGFTWTYDAATFGPTAVDWFDLTTVDPDTLIPIPRGPEKAAWDAVLEELREFPERVGPIGPQGPRGYVGEQGIKGDTGAIGATGPSGQGSVTPGPTGPKGDTGATGATGPQGNPGTPGANGATGAKGDTGAASTVAGPKGDTGATGLQGVKGDTGATGATGAASTVAGPKGDTGAAGAAGTPGATGAQGVKGDTGAASTVAGPQGTQGIQGVKGDTGATGTKGDTGAASTVAGPQGVKGDTGVTGAAPRTRTTSSTSNTVAQSVTLTFALDSPLDLSVGQTASAVSSTNTNIGVWGGISAISTTSISIAVSSYGAGNSGTVVTSWIIGLSGIKGTNGTNGATGAQGVQGIQGNTGTTGATGPTGPTGPGLTTVFVPALLFGGDGVAGYGGSRYPGRVQTGNNGSTTTCDFSLPSDWNTFKIDILLTSTGGSGAWYFVASRAYVTTGNDMTANDTNTTFNMTCPNANILTTYTSHTAQTVSAGMLNHFRLYRDGANASDTGPDSMLIGILLTKQS